MKKLILIMLMNSILFAHSGGTNSLGCHKDLQNKTHCHEDVTATTNDDYNGTNLIYMAVIVGFIGWAFWWNNKDSK